ncbi:MAG: glycosyltransferase family 2 protein [Verrucomicrobia bacterium]|nr:glycosyltransferase family 2 protein [Verrucomicrobiota bacterium]
MSDEQQPAIEISVAVLCYCAQEAIVPFVEQLHRMMSMFRSGWELVLVSNYWPGKNDRTPAICRELAARLPNVRVLAEPKQDAMGWDMRRGLDACNGRYIGVIDGDSQFPIEAIFSCFAKIKADDLDFVKTYRVMRADGWLRIFISKVYNVLFQIMFRDYRGFRDVNSKPKIMKRDAYRRMTLESTDWFIDAEIVLNCLALKLRMYEIPIRFNALGGRKSFVNTSTIFEFIRHMFAYRFGPRYKAHLQTK